MQKIKNDELNLELKSKNIEYNEVQEDYQFIPGGYFLSEAELTAYMTDFLIEKHEISIAKFLTIDSKDGTRFSITVYRLGSKERFKALTRYEATRKAVESL